MSLTQNNDNDFLSLLYAQREILKRLNRDKNSIASDSDRIESAGQMGESATNSTPTSVKHGRHGEVSDPLYLMNEPIIERRLSQDELVQRAKTRRVSGGFDIRSTRTAPFSGAFIEDKRQSKRTKSKPNFFQNASISDRSSKRQKTLYGMLANALVFDVESTAARAPSNIDRSRKMELAKRGFVKAPTEGCERVEQLNSNIDLATLRGEIENFVTAMEKSIKSQQDIHNWDRMMGLKRSHSKTMRLSMRSRNKLRKVINV
jgi:hypothetical protein